MEDYPVDGRYSEINKRAVEYYMLTREHPEFIIPSEFASIQDILNFGERFVTAFIQESRAANIPKILGIYNAIKNNKIFSVVEFQHSINTSIAKQYYLLLNNTISFGTYVSEMMTFVQSFSKDLYFENFWHQSYQHNIFIYDKSLADIAINETVIEEDRESLRRFTEKLNSGEVVELNSNTSTIISKIIFNEIIPVEDIDPFNVTQIFSSLDIYLKNIDHPSEIEIKNADELIELHGSIGLYLHYLFSIKSVRLAASIANIQVDALGSEENVKIVSRFLYNRTKLFSEYYKKNLAGDFVYADNLYLRVVSYYFEKKVKKSRSLEDDVATNAEIDKVYEAFPEIKEMGLLESYRHARTHESPMLTKSPEMKPKEYPILINGNLLDINNPLAREEIENLINNAIESSSENVQADFSNALERLNRPNIWEIYIANVVRALTESSDNLDRIKVLIKEANAGTKNNAKERIILLSELGTYVTKGGEKAIVVSFIDNGNPKFNKRLCALVFIVEFSNEGNRIELLVKTPEEVTPEIGWTTIDSIVESISEEVDNERKVATLPDFILNFIRENQASNLFSNLNLEVDNFAESMALTITYILEKNPTFENTEDRLLFQELLQLCSNDSRLKLALETNLGDCVAAGLINIYFQSSINEEIVQKNQKNNIARSIIQYLSGTAKVDKFDSFVIDAQNKFNKLGIPQTETANKEWITSNTTRIHFCYVNSKLEIMITKHKH